MSREKESVIASIFNAFRSQLIPVKATHNPGRFTGIFARNKSAPESSLLSLTATHPSLHVRPAFIDDTQDAKLKEGKKSFSYSLLDTMAPVLRAAWPSGVSPTEELAEILVKRVEEKRAKEEAKRAHQGKGVGFDGEGEEVGFLIENVGLRRLAGL